MTTLVERDPLGTRMKGYESVHRAVLPKRTYTIMRLDGRAFHSYTKGMNRPYDTAFITSMNGTARHLANAVSGCKLAYVQSDEISLVLTDFDNPGTEAWFGGQVQKMVSISAAIASTVFNSLHRNHAIGGRLATFDSRVFTVPPRSEVEQYFIWRQRDCVRNSISMLAQTRFSHRELKGVSSGGMQEMLWSQKGINWNDTPDGVKRGRIIRKVTRIEPVTYIRKDTNERITEEHMRSVWEIEDAPHFAPDGFITRLLPLPE